MKKRNRRAAMIYKVRDKYGCTRGAYPSRPLALYVASLIPGAVVWLEVM